MQRIRKLPAFVVAGIALALLPACASTNAPVASSRPRVIVSTDIGGTDFDDFQSMVHLLVCADSLDIEGLLSSPYGGGRKEQILKIIDCYERDFPNLKTYSDKYPTPDALRAITKQGALDTAGYAGFAAPSEGSEWIVKCARRPDPRPLYVLIWGGIEDLAQALHDAPDILPKLRVYFIGGPNKKWSVDAYHYIATHHPKLWMIEANVTYYGWFIGGNQSGDLGNDAFVAAHVAGRGALGDYFAQIKPTIKMGDSPTVGWLLRGTPEDPSQPGWGGQFVRAWERSHKVFERLTTAADEIEEFGVFELALAVGAGAPEKPEARMKIENQSLPGTVDAKGVMRFRFSPKEAKVYDYTILATNVPALNGKTGALTSVLLAPDAALRPSPRLPNWWTDDPAPAEAEGPRFGARTVSRWREEFLRDFAARMERCKTPAPAGTGVKP